MFTHAIARTPGSTLAAGITEANLGVPDLNRATRQHRDYINALEALGVRVTLLPPSAEFPDSVFVEDVAICFPGYAVITRPGAPSRRDETVLIEPALKECFANIERIQAPGTLDGGDVMVAGDRVFVGLSARTNAAGAQQLIDIVGALGYTGVPVTDCRFLHLKTGVSYLENGKMLVAEDMAEHPLFKDFNTIRINAAEAYAANSLWINGTVLVPAGHDRSRQRISDAGFETLELEMSEFQKLDGGLSCLSLRF